MSKWSMFYLTLVLSFMLSGCGALLPAKFNETEYRTLVSMATVVELGKCDIETASKLKELSVFLKYYTKYLPNNTDIHTATVGLYEIVEELDERTKAGEPISEAYCEMKLEILAGTIDTLQYGVGGKVR